MTKKELMNKYADTLAKIEVANPKEDGTTYDMGVCLDMLISDYTSKCLGETPRYIFDGIEEFDFEEFGKDYKTIE